jgi:hypothetical protein
MCFQIRYLQSQINTAVQNWKKVLNLSTLKQVKVLFHPSSPTSNNKREEELLF